MAKEAGRKKSGLRTAGAAQGRAKASTEKMRRDTRKTTPRSRAAKKELFDVNAAPIEKSKSVRSDGMQQIILPMGVVAPQPKEEKKSQRRISQNRKNNHRKMREQTDNPQREESKQRRRLTRGEQRRRRNRRRLFLWLVLLGLLALGFFFSMNVLFKVDSYRVVNADASQADNIGIYAEDTVISALNVPCGDNLFGFNLNDKAAAMEKTLPYLETIKIKRSLPTTVVVQVTPAVETYCVQGDFGWAVVSSGFKTLAVQGDEPANLIRLFVPLGQIPAAGQRLQFGEVADSTPTEDVGAAADLDELVQLLLSENLFDGVTQIDLQDLQEITFTYADRVLVRVGTANNLDYKMQLAGYIIRNDDGNCIDENDRGTLDVSHQKADGSIEAVFSPENTVDITATMIPQTSEDAAESDANAALDVENPAPEDTEAVDVTD